MKLPKTKKIDIYKLLFRISFASLLVSLFSQMYITNKLAVRSSELVELNNRKEQLEKELASLEYENSVLSSLSNIETKALSAGFIKQTDSVLAIKDPSTAVLLQAR